MFAACGGDEPMMMGSQTPGPAGIAAPPIMGTAGTGTSGTGAAGRTTSGAAGSTPGAAGRPSAGGAGAPAATAGMGGMMMAAGTSAATAGSGGMAGATTMAGSGGAAGMGGNSDGGGESACLDGITNYDSAGPFKYEAKTMGQVKMWVPMVPAGCKVPLVHLNNGTGATCAAYQMVLERFASHGFLTLCYEDPNTGAGAMGVTAFDTAMKAYPDLAAKKLGSTGHSQGGQAAFTTLQLAEAKWGMTDYIYAGLAMEPASGFGTQPTGGSWQSVYMKIKSPMFMFSGTSDMLVPQAWVQQAFDALDKSIEAYHWSAIGATHIPTPQPETMYIGVAWWRWKLLGDKKACEWFKMQPAGDKWNSIKEQNAKSCM
jgi:hypothetical protein